MNNTEISTFADHLSKDTPLEVCIARDKIRKNPIGGDQIRAMYIKNLLTKAL